jgi:lipopolysaccharide assembly outer membrane protein LptD (OstA)
MLNKTFLQLFLFIVIFLISFFFLKIYFIKKNITNTSKNVETINNEKNFNEKKSNLIYNIEYISEFKDGDFYVISSEFAEIVHNKTELIKMKKVIATINMNSSIPIKIYADNAIYNDINNNTNFYGNVLMTYNMHIINSDNLDLMFEKNLVVLSNNIIYKNLNTKLEADKIEVNLITKSSKIFMNNISDTVKIININ